LFSKVIYFLVEGGLTPHDTLLIDEIDLWGVDPPYEGRTMRIEKNQMLVVLKSNIFFG
jgi:hypothetical protein